jgi:hypothetical protein
MAPLLCGYPPSRPVHPRLQGRSQEQWAYEDLVTDDCPSRTVYHGGRMQQAFEIGEKPAEFVKWLGEKYDLTPTSGW